MARFGDLPPDIILHIWRHIQVVDIDSFALVSHDIRALGAKQIIEHEHLKKKYSIVWSGPKDNAFRYFRGDRQSKISMHRYLITIIRDILSKPRHAEYVQQIHVSNIAGTYTELYSDEEQEERMEQTEATYDLLQYLMEKTPHVTGAEFSRYLPDDKKFYWWDQIEKGSEDPILGILLPLLPNLHTIQWEPYIEEANLCLALVR